MNTSDRWIGGLVLAAILIVAAFAFVGSLSIFRFATGYAAPLRYSIPKYMRTQLLQCGLPAVLATDFLAAALCDHLLLVADHQQRIRISRVQVIANAMNSCEGLARVVVEMSFAEAPMPADWLRPIMRTHHLVRADDKGACFGGWRGHGS